VVSACGASAATGLHLALAPSAGFARTGNHTTADWPRAFALGVVMWKSVRERFDAKWTPEPNTGCWLWIASGDRDGYGRFDHGAAHRWAWMLYRGPIPEGMVLDHMCRVRSCVNPDHLRVVTPRINALENSHAHAAVNAAKTHCIHGHPLSGDNLWIAPRGERGEATKRFCWICEIARRRRLEVKRGVARRIAKSTAKEHGGLAHG
jgi:hypothetical protein